MMLNKKLGFWLKFFRGETFSINFIRSGTFVVAAAVVIVVIVVAAVEKIEKAFPKVSYLLARLAASDELFLVIWIFFQFHIH